MKYRCMQITDPEFGDEDWQAYNDLLAELHRRYDSPFVRTTWQQTRQRIGSFFRQIPDHHRMMIYMGTETVGWADLRVNNPRGESQTGFFISDVLSDSPPREMSAAIGREIIELAGRYGLEKMHSFTTAPRVSRLIDWWRPKQIATTVRYRLHRDKAETDVIKKWVQEIPRQNQSLRVELFTTIPDKYVKRYVELYERFIRDIPCGDPEGMEFSLSVDEVRLQEKWRGENNAFWYTCALLDERDQLVGFSNGAINGSDPADMYQAMTGLEKPYRGRKLAKWLKAALYLKVGEDFPGNETLTTDMRSINEPILAINSQMGFVHISEGQEYKIRIDGIRRCLSDND